MANDNNNLLADRETWLMLLDNAFRTDSIGANTLARLLFTVKAAIENGPDDLGRVINTLLDGIKQSYLYTDEHKLALRLYMLSLTGQLKPQDEPRILLNGAIERGMTEIERARRKQRAAKHQHTSKRDTLKKK
jgi:hypothetical protein